MEEDYKLLPLPLPNNNNDDEMKCRCFRPLFLHYEGCIGPRTAWANEVKFLWNLPQSSIEPATFYSESSDEDDNNNNNNNNTTLWDMIGQHTLIV